MAPRAAAGGERSIEPHVDLQSRLSVVHLEAAAMSLCHEAAQIHAESDAAGGSLARAIRPVERFGQVRQLRLIDTGAEVVTCSTMLAPSSAARSDTRGGSAASAP